MKAYMIRNKATGLYWRKGTYGARGWIKKERASIWLTKGGLSSAQRTIAAGVWEAVTFECTEVL